MQDVQLPAKPFMSVDDAAKILGCTGGRVRQLLIAEAEEPGTGIVGIKLNERAWAVDRKSLEKYAGREMTTGRPRSHG